MTRLLATVGILAFALEGIAGVLAPGQLVEQLQSENFREREAAAAALRKAGPEAIPALRKAAASSESPEVRQRAAAILRKLQFAAISGQLLAPKMVKLDYRATPLARALHDLRTRTSLNLVLDTENRGDPFRTVTCSTGEVTVWEALDAFCAAAGLHEKFLAEFTPPKRPGPLGGYSGYTVPPSMIGVDVPILLSAGEPQRVVGDRRTAVRVLVLPPSFPDHRVTLGTGDTTLCFDVRPSAGLNWQGVSAVKITRLIDEAGCIGRAANPISNTLESGPTYGFGGFGVQGQLGQFGNLGGQFGLQGGLTGFGATAQPRPVPNPCIQPVALKLATPHARRIKRLEGSLFGEIILPNQTLVTVNEPEKHIGATVTGQGDVRLTVVSLTQTVEGTKAQLLLEYPAPWSIGARRGFNPGGIWPEPPRPGSTIPLVDVQDASGRRIQVETAQQTPVSLGDGSTIAMRINWTWRKEAGMPAKFLVVGPQTTTVEIPFAFDDVPLP